MKKKEIWKSVQNWITSEEQSRTFLEYISYLNEQISKQKSNNLELYYQKEETKKETDFFIVTPYLIQLYKGLITESEGTIQIERIQMITQITFDFGTSKITHENLESFISAFHLLIPFIEIEAYILDGLTKGALNYYQEKDIDGLYERILVTSHYLKMCNQNQKMFKHNMKQKLFYITKL